LINIEGNHYFPPSSVTPGVLSDSTTQYTCPWKGAARYHHIQIGPDVHRDAAWSYPQPHPTAFDRVERDFTDYVAFDPQQVSIGL
jgi:uncharacterized protein (DUF427 family)